MIHDVAIAIRRLQRDGAIRTAMVVDTDVHHGNGTAAIFAKDESVFTLSIHQENNYPSPKPPSNIRFASAGWNWRRRISGDSWRGNVQAFDEFHPDIIFYVAGADPYREDQLGGLALTIEGLLRRDRWYFNMRGGRIPVAITLAGGYARRVEDTVKIHVNTIVAARDAMNTAHSV